MAPGKGPPELPLTCGRCGSTRLAQKPDGSAECSECHAVVNVRAQAPGRKTPLEPAVGQTDSFVFSQNPRSYSDHEHFWVPARRLSHGDITLASWVESLKHVYLHQNSFECQRCGLQMLSRSEQGGSHATVFAPDTFLHTCARCGNLYRDGHPFSEISDSMGRPYCSPDCLRVVVEALRKAETRRLILSLETMVRNASDDNVRARARERLGVIATDEEEPLAVLARDALARLNSSLSANSR